MTLVKIPNSENAFVDLRKLRDYALNAEHRVGRHKAYLFQKFLGLSAADAEDLRLLLLDIVQRDEAVLGVKDRHGQHYHIDFALEWHGQKALIRSAWNIRFGEDFPRLVTCYPLKEIIE